jgi:hypothetical protein
MRSPRTLQGGPLRQPNPPPEWSHPARATIVSWCTLSGMSRSASYAALSAGHLRAVKMGSRTLIEVRQGLVWLDSLPRATFRSVRAA